MAIPNNDPTPSIHDTPISLPELPPPLRHLSPYVQRALELQFKDPVMCYWCLYFSAKQGVATKGGKECRPFLFALMDILEKTKRELNTDTVASDEAGSAYIENFALRVFTLADNEDRQGHASRSTAKKFLAAANFLELLTVFDVQDQADNEQKIKYSKWKAADIAKAFREGRKPTPGPAGSSFEDMPPASGAVSPSQNALQSFLSPQQHGESLSVFGSIPPSIAPSPIHNPISVPLPVSPAALGQSADLPTLNDLTPVPSPPKISSPLKGPSPERVDQRGIHVASSFHSKNTNGNGHVKLGGPPHTPDSSLKAPSKDRDAISPGAWSNVATPGQDDSRVKGKFNEETFGHHRLPSARLFSSSPSPPDRRESRSYEVNEVEEDEDDDEIEQHLRRQNQLTREMSGDENGPSSPIRPGPGIAPSRQESWSSTIANRGDTPSRSSSWNSPFAEDGERPSISRQTTLNAIPETSSVVQSDPTEVEASDVLSPLPSTISTSRRVHFTPSVIGGLSSIASESPQNSPIGGGVASIPLPPSTDSDISEDTSRGATAHTTIAPSPTEAADESQPVISYTLPNPSGHSPTRSGFGGVRSPPQGSLHMTGSAASGSGSLGGGSAQNGNGLPSAPATSPRLSTVPIPPISAIRPTDFSLPDNSHISALPSTPSAPPGPPMSATPSAPAYPPTPYPRTSVPLALPDAIAPEDSSRAKKHAKFAISALDYDDLDTARRELVRALAVLGVDVAL